MYKNKRILAIIPARGGSKGLPGKNIRPFCGKPLISWTISQALASRYLDKVVVSTDDKKIAARSLKFGACVPFFRPKKLATSTSNIIDVVIHALDFFGKKHINYDLVMLLQPTSPLRTNEDIDKTIGLFFEKKASAVISVCRCEHHPWWSVALSKGSKIEKFQGTGQLHKNRQSLPDFYRINGAVYVAQVNYLKENHGFLGKSTFAYIMPPERSVDIDTNWDLIIAQSIKRILHTNSL